jgi:hypothetical protein
MMQPRMWWAGADQGWMIDTETALTEGEVLRCAQFTAKVQNDRLKTLWPGPKRDECMQTLVALGHMKITQNIVGKGDKVLYDAYKSEGKKVFA